MSAHAGSADGRPYRVIGIGASAGGVDALVKVFAGLRADLAAAVCVVLHLPPTGPSLLAPILDRQTELPVHAAVDGEPLRAGRVYVAPPDRHLLVRGGRIVLSGGPKENGVRPAVDAMLRSIAAHGDGAVAVVLSGALGDGSSGALAVARAGGWVIVQEPGDALVPSMPEHALAAVGRADEVLSAAEIGPALGRLADTRPEMREDATMAVGENLIEASRHRPEGPASGLTCPECSGALWEVREGELVRYRCRVGHAFSEDAMVVEQGTAAEAALWTALEVLEERAELLRKVAERRGGAHPRLRARLETAAADALERADLIRHALAASPDRPDAFRLEGPAKAAGGVE